MLVTVRLRVLSAAVPALAAALLVLGSRCTDAAHSFLLYAGVIHADAGCASGMALGPSAMQIGGLGLIVAASAIGNSVAVREAIASLFGRLMTVRPFARPVPVPVLSGYSRRRTWGVDCGVGSRDPPRP